MSSHPDGAVDTIKPIDAASLDADPLVDVILDFDAAKDLVLDANNKVTGWKDQSGKHNDATAPASPAPTAVSANVSFNGSTRAVVRFDGNSFLTAVPHVPPTGTLFLLQASSATTTNNRTIGWASFATGADGIDFETGMGAAPMLAIARKTGAPATGDVSGTSPVTTFELDVMSWGAAGITLERIKPGLSTESGTNGMLMMVGDGGYMLHIGSSGEGDARFHGDIMRLRVYDKQLSQNERAVIASALMMP